MFIKVLCFWNGFTWNVLIITESAAGDGKLNVEQLELRLIQSKHDIENGEVILKAKLVV